MAFLPMLSPSIRDTAERSELIDPYDAPLSHSLVKNLRTSGISAVKTGVSVTWQKIHHFFIDESNCRREELA